MALRIAFDLDGVLADMEGALARHAEELFGVSVAPAPPEQPAAASDGTNAAGPPDAGTPAGDTAEGEEPPLLRLKLSSRQQRRLWRHVEQIDGFWESLDEIEPGAVARLAVLAAERRWELIFVTKRPDSAGPTAQIQTQRWLAAKGFPLPSVYVVQHSRGRIAASLDLDIVVDDRPENCLDVLVDSKARAILVWRDDQQLLPAAARRLGIGVVASVAECLDILTEIDSPAPQNQSVLGRVRRMLGVVG